MVPNEKNKKQIMETANDKRKLTDLVIDIFALKPVLSPRWNALIQNNDDNAANMPVPQKDNGRIQMPIADVIICGG